jgi:hypothetical protein
MWFCFGFLGEVVRFGVLKGGVKVRVFKGCGYVMGI